MIVLQRRKTSMLKYLKGYNMREELEYLEELKIKCKDLSISDQRELINELMEDMEVEDYNLTFEDNYGLSYAKSYYLDNQDDVLSDIANTMWFTPDGRDVADFISFDNSHIVAEQVALKEPDVAKALYEELDYWKTRWI